MTAQEWEDLCDGCGQCCTIKESKPPNRIACPGLDVSTNRCMIYETRHDRWPCAKITPSNVKRLHRQGTLPDSCAYVRHSQDLPPLENPPKATHLPFVLATAEFKLKFVRNAKLLGKQAQ